MKRNGLLTVKLFLTVWFALSIVTYPVFAEETAVQSDKNNVAVHKPDSSKYGQNSQQNRRFASGFLSLSNPCSGCRMA